MPYLLDVCFVVAIGSFVYSYVLYRMRLEVKADGDPFTTVNNFGIMASSMITAAMTFVGKMVGKPCEVLMKKTFTCIVDAVCMRRTGKKIPVLKS